MKNNFAGLFRQLEEAGFQSSEETRRVISKRFEFSLRGQAATAAEINNQHISNCRLDDLLLERYWLINSAMPEEAFVLELKGIERDQDLIFLQIEGSEVGVYVKPEHFMSAWETAEFDELRIQLPDAPILGLRDGRIVVMIMPTNATGSFVSSREALSHGNWEELD